MRSHAIVIVRIVFQNSAQMCLAQNNDVIQTLAPDRAVRQSRSAKVRLVQWVVADAHGAQSAPDDAAIDPVAIADQVVRSLIPRKCLGYLTCNPLRCPVGCDVDPDEVFTIEPHDDQAIEQVEANGRDNKPVHGGNVWSMITQESAPSLAGRSSPLDHVLGNARLSDFKPKLEQFAMNTRWPSGPGDFHPESLTDSGLDTLASSGSCHRLKAAAFR